MIMVHAFPVVTCVLIRDMDLTVRREVCRLLGMESFVGNDCRKLAEMEGMNMMQIRSMWEEARNAYSPTETILRWIEEKGSSVATIAALRKTLVQIKRRDAVDVIDDAYRQNEQGQQEMI